MNAQIKKALSLAVGATMVASALAIAAPAGADDTYTPSLRPKAAPGAAVAVESVATFRPTTAAKRATRIRAKKAPRATATASTSSGTSTKSSTSTRSKTSELSQARSILAGLIAKHPILKGTTVEIGDARGYQAVAYYRSGRIVISKSHTASLTRILNHEVWHIIDWRDNGKIDWGEKVPPR